MIPRAVADLAQLDDDALFRELARGMRLCLANALRLWRDAKLLAAMRRPQAFQIIKFLAEEEAAKVHILLDAARCPRNQSDGFARHLKCFSDHLARGLYAGYYEWRPMDLSEAQQHLDRERQTLYLDGPNDVDWIFRNEIERRREEAMYVDYLAVRDHFHDDHVWHSPNPVLLRMYLLATMSSILRVAQDLHHVGITKPEALRVVARLWRSAPPLENLTWPEIRDLNIRTLDQLDRENLLRKAPQTAYAAVANEWRAPLYQLDLRRLEVKPADLRDAQERWSPDYF